MKKALVIFLTLAMAFGAFADEPVADVKVADFKGDASLTFGIDLNQDKDYVLTGFKNETNASLKLNLFNSGSKSTTGDGIWGELDVSFGGASLSSDSDYSKFTASILKAQINFGPVYMGILKGDFGYGGSYLFPNALNYSDSSDDYVSNASKDLEYDQGFVLGYKNDMFSVQSSFRSKKNTSKKLDRVETFVAGSAQKVKKGEKIYNGNITDAYQDNNVLPEGTTLTKGNVYYKRIEKDDSSQYWTNKYAVGLNAEIKPIKDLRIGLGAGYALGNVGLKAEHAKDDDNKGDVTFFAGFDYRFNINDTYFIQPTLAYKLYVDAVWDVTDKKLVYEDRISTSNLGFGLRFGWKGSSVGNSILSDFFGSNLFYNTGKDNKNDSSLLPGVAVYAGFDFKTKDAMKTKLPVMVTFYSGDTLVPGLKAYALVGVNAGPEAGKVTNNTAKAIEETTAVKEVYDEYAKGKGLQVGVGAGYDIKVDEVTLTPAAAILWTSGTKKGDVANVSYKGVFNRFNFGVKFDVKGLVDNTTFSVKWAGDEYGNMKGNANGVETSYEKVDNGELTFTVKIAL